MSFFDTLQHATRQERDTLFNLPIIRKALTGDVSLESYRAFLTQAYYHVRHTVPLMMACGARLPQRLECCGQQCVNTSMKSTGTKNGFSMTSRRAVATPMPSAPASRNCPSN